MLLKLKEFGLKNLQDIFVKRKYNKYDKVKIVKKLPYFTESNIKDFDGAEKEGFNKFNFNAIDFDLTRKKFFPIIGYKSSDALIINDDNKMTFIEFKQINTEKKGNKYFKELGKYIKDLKFKYKVKHSFLILENIINNTHFICPGKNELFDKKEKQFIFSIDVKKMDNNLENILTLETFGYERVEDNLKVFWVEKKDLEEYL